MWQSITGNLFRNAALALLALLAAIAADARAQFMPGDVLVDNFSGNNIQQYSTIGTLKHTFTGTGSNWRGASLTPTGNLVTTYDTNGIHGPGVNIFSPSGAQIATFSTPQVALPGDVSVFPDGTLAVVDQFGSNTSHHAFDLYRQNGTFLGTINSPDGNDPFASTIAPDGSLWAVTSESGILFNVQESGALLSSVSTGDLQFNINTLVVDPKNGSLWVSDRNAPKLFDLSPSATVLMSFNTLAPNSTGGIGLASDGTLWTDSFTGSNMYHYSTTGALIGSFAIVDANVPAFIAVVPGVPEPSTLVLAAFGFAGLAPWGWRRRKLLGHRIAPS